MLRIKLHSPVCDYELQIRCDCPDCYRLVPTSVEGRKEVEGGGGQVGVIYTPQSHLSCDGIGYGPLLQESLMIRRIKIKV